MGWNEIDNKLKRRLDSKFVSCDENYELDLIKDVIQEEFPNISPERIEEAISSCCDKVAAPRPRKEFIECLKAILA